MSRSRRPSSDAAGDVAAGVTVLDWPAFAELFRRRHKQGEGVAIVGPSGSGKSTLGLELCKLKAAGKARDGRPARVTILAAKPRDRTVTALGWPVVKTWPPSYGQEHCVVWPKGGGDAQERAGRQRRVFAPLMQVIFGEGGQTVYIDECAYFERPPPNGLGLGATMELYWTEARAMDLTPIGGTQRPRKVTRSMWSEPKWVMIFRLDDEDDLKRVGEIGGNRREIFELAQALGGHEFLCVVKPAGGTRELYVSRVGQG